MSDFEDGKPRSSPRLFYHVCVFHRKKMFFHLSMVLRPEEESLMTNYDSTHIVESTTDHFYILEIKIKVTCNDHRSIKAIVTKTY